MLPKKNTKKESRAKKWFPKPPKSRAPKDWKEKLDEHLTKVKWDEQDDLDAMVAERTEANPDFPAMVAKAEQKRKRTKTRGD